MTIQEYEELKLQIMRLIRPNRRLYDYYLSAGVKYLINPDTNELHRVGQGYFEGSHNLQTAHLEDFIPGNIVDDVLPIHLLSNGEELLFYDFLTDDLIGYRLNKCQYCFPSITD